MNGKRIHGLDGLRAISIVLVLFCHLADGWRLAPYGTFGVSIFFVISGFLITRLLCLEEDRHGSISLATFYARRALRILPPAFLFLAVVQILAWLGLAAVDRGDILRCALFIRNMGAEGGVHTGHFWSLAIEEQFYFVWPLVFLALRHNTKRLMIVAGLFAVSPLWFHLRVSHGANPTAFDIRSGYLLAGCALALAHHNGQIAQVLCRRIFRHWSIPLFAIAAICLVNGPLFHLGAVIPMCEALSVALVINYAVQSRGKFLNHPAMVWLGGLSYSLYLWQQIFCYRSQLGWAGRFPQNIIFAIAAASLSFYALEQPLAAIRRKVAFIPNSSFLGFLFGERMMPTATGTHPVSEAKTLRSPDLAEVVFNVDGDLKRRREFNVEK